MFLYVGTWNTYEKSIVQRASHAHVVFVTAGEEAAEGTALGGGVQDAGTKSARARKPMINLRHQFMK